MLVALPHREEAAVLLTPALSASPRKYIGIVAVTIMMKAELATS